MLQKWLLECQHNDQGVSLFQRQLTTLKQESDSKTKAMEAHKCTITKKEEELKHLSHQLKMQEAMMQQKLQQQRVQLLEAGTATQELELEEQVQRLMSEITELQSRLIQAEDEKQEAMIHLEADRIENWLLVEYMTELTASKSKVCRRFL